MNSPASTDIGSVHSNIFSVQHSCSPASSIEFSSPNRNSKPVANACCTSDNKLRPECKSLFVEALVDSAAIIIETVWPSSSESTCYISQSLPLKRFIQETLRRSRTSYSTLQLALYYIIRIKQSIYDTRAYNRSIGNVVKRNENLGLRCGRRAFLSALMIASKYVQDRNYSIRAWGKISGLPVPELCENEQLFLSTMGWNAHVKHTIYERWSGVLFECACDYSCSKHSVWVERFKTLDPTIGGVESWRSTTSSVYHKETVPISDEPLSKPRELTCANLQNLSDVTLKRKRTDDNDTKEADLPSKRVTPRKQLEATQSRVHEWTVCVATHLMQTCADPVSV